MSHITVKREAEKWCRFDSTNVSTGHEILAAVYAYDKLKKNEALSQCKSHTNDRTSSSNSFLLPTPEKRGLQNHVFRERRHAIRKYYATIKFLKLFQAKRKAA